MWQKENMLKRRNVIKQNKYWECWRKGRDYPERKKVDLMMRIHPVKLQTGCTIQYVHIYRVMNPCFKTFKLNNYWKLGNFLQFSLFRIYQFTVFCGFSTKHWTPCIRAEIKGRMWEGWWESVRKLRIKDGMELDYLFWL